MHLLKIARVPAVSLGISGTVRDAVDTMTSAGAGAVVVVGSSGDAAGIFTATDLLRRVVARGRALEDTPIREVMTSPLTFAGAATSCEEALRLMATNHIRHLPILNDGGRALGMLSTRHLLRAMVDNLSNELHSLNAYICADGIGG